MQKKIAPENLEWKEGKVKNFFGKELISLKNGTLKLIKVAPQASYPLHHHPDKTEYAYVLKGSPEFEISGEHFTGKPDEFFIFPQNENHTILNKTDETCLMLVGAINH
ncbi:MAG TPA: cupin domain-containing protein [Chitinophagaceae bacterium]|jgi:quercetin dioxygenase-like cupin family protein|nr:cupin domain-containing protein [Chitinophagaceae bacterium]